MPLMFQGFSRSTGGRIRHDAVCYSRNFTASRLEKLGRVDVDSILAEAFRGELVPQDSNDEPASVLLERIRQQRNDSTPTQFRSTSRRQRQAVR
jgi:hypothetical protein